MIYNYSNYPNKQKIAHPEPTFWSVLLTYYLLIFGLANGVVVIMYIFSDQPMGTRRRVCQFYLLGRDVL